MKIVVLLAAMLLALSNFALADDLNQLEGLAFVENRVVGELDTVYDFPLKVDMPMPADNTANVKQYKMADVNMNVKALKRLLAGKTMTDAEDARWEYLVYGEDALFLFQDEELKYTWPHAYRKFSPLDPENASSALKSADQTVRSILDELNVVYEYPFYTVCEAYKTLNTQLLSTRITSKEEVAQRLLSSNSDEQLYDYEYIQGRKGFDDDYILVIARLQVDDIPFAIGAIKSPSYKDDNPIFDEGVFGEFQLNSKGQITYAQISNMQTVVQEAVEQRAILPWTECILALCNDDQAFLNMHSAMLVRAELCYAINQRHVTYPVWQFVVEINDAQSEFPSEAYPFPYYVDAITGARL